MKRNILSILALIGFVILGIIFLKGHTGELSKILEVDLGYAAILFLLVFFHLIIRGHMLKTLMNFYGLKLKFKEWFGLQIITHWGNQLIPFKGGLFTRAVYFKKKYKFLYTSSASVVGIAYLIDFIGYGLFGIIFSFFLPVANDIKYSVLIFFAIIFLGSVFMLFFLPSSITLLLSKKVNIKILKYLIDGICEIQRIKTEGKLILYLFFNFCGRLLFGTLRLYVAFRAFGFMISFYDCLVISLFLGLAMIISITPMNLGFRESIIVVSSKLFGIGTLLSTFVAVLDRAIVLIWIFLLAPIFSYILLKNFKTIKKEDKAEMIQN